MSLGVAMALLSALTQAVAHALLAGGRDKLAIRGLIGLTGMVVALPGTLLVALPSRELWFWLLASGVLHAVYQLVLIRAYEQEDFSVAYPLARGVAPVATTLLGVVLLGDRIGAAAFVGVVTVTLGLWLIAFGRRAGMSGLAAAMGAGLLTTAYTLLDAHAVRLDPQVWTFIVWFFIFDGVIMLLINALVRRKNLLPALRQEWSPGIKAGIASLITYSSALIALRLMAAGPVSALRETSVVFGVIIGVAVLREQFTARRMYGALMVAAGGIVVALTS